MKNLYLMFLASLDNKRENGFSGRKLTALTTMALVVFIHLKYISKENAIEALMIDCGFILILLGIVTMQQITEFKNGKTDEKAV